MSDHINTSPSTVSANAKKKANERLAAASTAATTGPTPAPTRSTSGGSGPLQPIENPNSSPEDLGGKKGNRLSSAETKNIPGAFHNTYPSDYDENLGAGGFNFNTAPAAEKGDKMGQTVFAHRPRPSTADPNSGPGVNRKDSAFEVHGGEDCDECCSNNDEEVDRVAARERAVTSLITQRFGKPMHEITLDDAKELQREAVSNSLLCLSPFRLSLHFSRYSRIPNPSALATIAFPFIRTHTNPRGPWSSQSLEAQPSFAFIRSVLGPGSPAARAQAAAAKNELRKTQNALAAEKKKILDTAGKEGVKAWYRERAKNGKNGANGGAPNDVEDLARYDKFSLAIRNAFLDNLLGTVASATATVGN